jgi:hypothetical protein
VDTSKSGSAEKHSEYQTVQKSGGKGDNYYSNVSREYTVSGTFRHVDLEQIKRLTGSDASLEKQKSAALSHWTSLIADYLTAYLQSQGTNFGIFAVGELDAMVRNQSIEGTNLRRLENGLWAFDFEITVAGPEDFLGRIRDSSIGQRQGEQITFSMAFPTDLIEASGVNPEDFDFADPKPSSTQLQFEAEAESNSADAYPRYRAFIRDGVFDITLYYGQVTVGSDPVLRATDIASAEDAYGLLKNIWDFETPVASFDALEVDSGPLTKTVDVVVDGEQRTVRIEVRIFHRKMFAETGRQNARRFRQEFKKRDVIVYAGHAGPNEGFDLHDGSEGEILPNEVRRWDLTDKQQLFIAAGCQTYSQYADMMYANPTKRARNLDVITTVNYAGGGLSFVYRHDVNLLLFNLMRGQRDGTLRPAAYSRLIEQTNSGFRTGPLDTFYGVIGLEDNPKRHPFSSPDSIGDLCETAINCGSPHAYVCYENQCAAKATNPRGCPERTEFSWLVPLDGSDGEPVGVCMWK